MATISRKIIDNVADDIAGLIRDHQAEIDEAYTNVEGALKVSLACTFKPSESSGAIDADIQISFKLDEVKEKMSRSYFEREQVKSDGPLFDHMEKERARRREILFRDFTAFAKTLVISGRAALKFRAFKLAA